MFYVLIADAAVYASVMFLAWWSCLDHPSVVVVPIGEPAAAPTELLRLRFSLACLVVPSSSPILAFRLPPRHFLPTPLHCVRPASPSSLLPPPSPSPARPGFCCLP